MSSRLRLALLGSAALAFVALAWWLSGIWSPTPPRSLTMATGPEGSACAVIGGRYRDALARVGVELRLRQTAGSVENLALLRDLSAGVSAGFLQAGTPGTPEADDLVSLGTVLYEPLWLFHRSAQPGLVAADLKGKRLAIGPEGSGTRTLSLRLLSLLGIDEHSAELQPLAPDEAADALVRGEIDLAAIVTSWEAPVVRRLVATPGIALAGFPRADALIARNPFLNKVILPAGVADLALNIPPADVVLIAPKSSLVVRRELHSALQYLLLDAASELHSRPGLFNRAGEFPAAEAIDVPLAEGAQQFYRTGRPFLQRHLPFWLAALAQRLLLVLVPLIGIIYPLASALPSLYVWNVRRRIFRLYADLKLIELEAEALPAGADTLDLAARLDALEERAARLKVPKFHASLAYTLRHHVRLVRDRIDRRA
jgi:TRAP transporter TAXI family solute receptor